MEQYNEVKTPDLFADFAPVDLLIGRTWRLVQMHMTEDAMVLIINSAIVGSDLAPPMWEGIRYIQRERDRELRELLADSVYGIVVRANTPTKEAA